MVSRLISGIICLESGELTLARQLCVEATPEIVVLHLPFAVGDGVLFIREIARLSPASRVVVLGPADHIGEVSRVFRAGAKGFMLRSGSPDEFRVAFEAVLRGERYVSHQIGQILLQDVAVGNRLSQMAAEDSLGLSERELIIFEKLALGIGPKAIGRELGISVKTIETHQKRIKRKLGIETAAELRKRAARWHASRLGRAIKDLPPTG